MPDRLAQLTALHQADPKDPFASYAIALEHIKAGRPEEALRWLDQTIGLDPNYCYAYFQKGKVLLKAGQPQPARAALTAGFDAANKSGQAKASQEIAALLETIQ